ncbi:hypothetical protein [Vineibacter terrae]|uniref:hypothetical protein n=1 Tax=Vineibacter terrae TaxID=2586908 RepID=UPI002E35D735|nr:hypothetical protein [Vineibacter terrae]HEX2886802.1 hypothetical protein [Vineibacter terrae]
MSASQREPLHVRQDLVRKAGNDTIDAVWRSSSLVDHPTDKLAVAVGGVAGALAGAIEIWCRAHGQPIREACDLDRETVRQIGIWIIDVIVEGWPTEPAEPADRRAP